MMLYKYFHPDRVQDVLNHKMLRFTPPMHLNDPFESLPYFSALAPDRAGLVRATARTIAASPPRVRSKLPQPLQSDDAIRLENWFIEHPLEFDRLMASWNPNGELLKEVTEHVYTAINSIGVFSLSAVPDNLLMWAHYADEHRGFVVEFDSSDEFFQKYANRAEMLDICRHPRPVEYVSSRPRVDLESMTEVQIFLTKSEDWAYEQEWRFGRGIGDADSCRGEIHLFELPPSCLSGVIMGCDMALKKKREIVSLVRESRDFGHVLLRQATRSSNRYAITILDLLFDSADIAKH